MYKRTIWQDHVEGIQEGTDLNADNFNNIEAGTMEANALAALNAAYRRYEHDVVKDLEVYSTITAYHIRGGEDSTVLISPRNNTNYRVVVEFVQSDPDVLSDANIMIIDKKLDRFTVRLGHSGTGEVNAMFYVSGGMI